MKSMYRAIILIIFSFWAGNAIAQTKVGDRWIDNNLGIRVEKESVRKRGELTICIYSTETNACIENLFTAFETRIFDDTGKEIWSALWMGQKKTVTFSKALSEAHKVVITATQPFVINIMTGTRIYQEKEITVEHILR